MNKKDKAKDSRLRKTYGITLKERDQMLIDQGGVCASCSELYPRMCVDHIHVLGFKKMKPEDKKKYVRGVVCFQCNVGFKTFDKLKDGKKNRARLEGTYKYFQRFKLKGEIS